MPNVHHCELTRTSDFTYFETPNQSCFIDILNFFRTSITIDHNHPKCQQYLISSASVNREKKHHEEAGNWIIHPFSRLRFFWESIMMLVYFIAFITIPFMVCFVVLDSEKVRLDNVNLFIYVLSWIDIASNCITGFYEENNSKVILDRKKILWRYIKSYMLIDIITSLPYDYITYPWRKEFGPDLTMTLINLLPLLKLGRYVTFTSYIKQMFMYLRDEDISYQMFLTFLLYFYVVHWFTCFCNATSLILMYSHEQYPLESENSWLLSRQIKVISHRYQRALYVVLENFTGSGNGGTVPSSEGHIMVCTILMILGRLFECYVIRVETKCIRNICQTYQNIIFFFTNIVMLLQIVADRKASESKYEQIVNQLSAYTRQKQLPTYMKQRLLDYYRYRFRNTYFREKKIVFNLSDALKQEVVLHSCRRLIENVDIFQDLSRNILTLIVTNLKPELYLAKDMIVRAGTQGDCMFFLSSGTVSVLTPTGKEVCFLEDGAYFGEVALLVQDQRRVASIVAVEVCEVYRLERKDFRKCIANHNDLFERIEKTATERMQQTVMIEEQHKRFAMQTRTTSKKSQS